MKLFITSLFMLILSTGICYAQGTFTYKIDQQAYSIEEQKLNDLFGQAFNTMIEDGQTKPKYFDIWVKAFTQWKKYTAQGYWTYETIGNRVSGYSYVGNIDEMFLGWDPGHKEPKGNPNNEKNWGKRMQYLNIYLSRQIIYYCTQRISSTKSPSQ